MPRRRLLTAAERARLLAFPETDDALIQQYTFSQSDLAVIDQRRGAHNRLGFAIQLCYLRYPGIALPTAAAPPARLLALVGQQLEIDPDVWFRYAQRAATRREHLAELQAWLNLSPFNGADYRRFIDPISELARQTDRGMVLAETLVAMLRQQHIILPPVAVIERVCSEALTRGTRLVYEALSAPLLDVHRDAFERILTIRAETSQSTLAWLRQSPGPSRPKHIRAHLERLQIVRDLDLPAGLEHTVHQNRLLKLAREGGQMTAQHLRDLEPTRRYATLVAILLDTRATLIDEIIDLHDRFMGSMFNKAKRKHAEQFQRSGKAINHKVRLYSRIGRALLDAKETGDDPFAAIEAIMPWAAFSESITEAEQLAQSENFDYLSLIGSGFNSLRRYTPTFLEALELKAAPAARELLAGAELLKDMNTLQARKVPDNAPCDFVRKRWQSLVYTADGIDRRFYELCVLSELKNALRSGDIWVQDSRQFKDFEDYLLPSKRFIDQREHRDLGLAVETDCDTYLESRLAALENQLDTVERLAAADTLPDAGFTPAGRLKITPLDNAVPGGADALMQHAYSRLPHLKITELLLERDYILLGRAKFQSWWTG